MPDPPTIRAPLSPGIGMRQTGIFDMIIGAYFYRQMAEFAEQLINPETICDSGFLMLGEYSIKMRSHQAASLKSNEPVRCLWFAPSSKHENVYEKPYNL